MKRKDNKHIIQLDGLRFFAVLMVMIAHWLQWQWGNPIVTKIPFGHGVTLFFVLSGFLISRILLTYRDEYSRLKISKWILIKQFYIRRFLRIFPLYYALIFLLFFLNFENTRELFIWLITYTTNIYQSIHNTYVGYFNHFWSLGVEEQFYLFWPFLILFTKKNKTLFAITLIIIMSLVIRGFLFVYIEKWMATSYFTLSCMHSLGIGALLAYFSIYNVTLLSKLAKVKWLYIALALYIMQLIIQHAYQLNWMIAIFDDFFFSILCFFTILRAYNGAYSGVSKRIIENKFVLYSGKISYGLYVFHLFTPFLYEIISENFHFSISNKYLGFILFYLITFIIAHFSWKYFEKPINQLKSKYPYIKIEKE